MKSARAVCCVRVGDGNDRSCHCVRVVPKCAAGSVAPQCAQNFADDCRLTCSRSDVVL